jgi:MazG family protein
MTKPPLDQFIETIARLRAPDGCPWDKEQTHQSLARYLLEETYEVLEAIHSGEPHKLQEELGDLLLQIVLHAQIAKEAGQYDINDIAQGINTKMINRHPHVFGDKNLNSAQEVVKQWEELKQEEKAAKNTHKNESVIDQVGRTLPALMQALKVSEKAVSQGFEWENKNDVWDKLLSELEELKAEIQAEKKQRRLIELELGDVLFTLVNVARWEDLNPEEALLLALDKFKSRYRQMEKISDKPLKELSKSQLNDLWNKAKATLAK